MTTILLITIVAVIAVLFFLWQPEKDDSDENTAPSQTTTLPEFSGSRIRVLSVSELIERLNLEPVINNIKLHSGLSTENWQKDGLPLIHNFLALVQRLPASESHHHAGDGGLARHTLDVAAIALKQAAGRSFPPNGKTEDIPRLTAVWKYGILVAALLHDVGKVLCSFKITLTDLNGKNQSIWLPDAGNMPTNQYYLVEFLSENQQYSAHAEIGWSFFKDLVPEDTRKWIANRSPDLIVLLRSYLSGKKDGSIIEELIKNADMASVSRDLATGSRQRFAHSKKAPLIEIIMDTLIEMLSDRGRYFTIAKDAGGDLFRKGDIIYMISKNVPDYIRKYLQENNPEIAQSFPTENSRIFDTLFEYRAILPNPFDNTKAITNIAVQFIKNDKTSVQTQFTVLAFNAKTLYPDGNYPTEFSGDLQVIEEKTIKSSQNHQEKTPMDNIVSGSLKDNSIDTNNTEMDTQNDNYTVPPIMAQQMNIENTIHNEEDDATSLAVLLNTDTVKDNQKDAFYQAFSSDTENKQTLPENNSGSHNQNKMDTEINEISSIDDLLSQTGVFDHTDTDETVIEQNSITQNKHNNATKNKKENQQETLKKLKSIFGDDFNDKNKQQNKKEEKIIETVEIETIEKPQETMLVTETENNQQQQDNTNNTAVNEMPRPIPVKTPNTLDNIYESKRDLTIKKALSNHIENEPNPLKQQGLTFLHWLADGLADGSITFNTAQSFVHFVEQGMLVVTPAAFREFTGEFNARNPNCPGRETQKGFELLNLIERGVRRTSLYRALSNEQPLFFCYLIPDTRLHHLIQMSTRPANNPNLSIIPADEIFYKKDK